MRAVRGRARYATHRRVASTFRDYPRHQSQNRHMDASDVRSFDMLKAAFEIDYSIWKEERQPWPYKRDGAGAQDIIQKWNAANRIARLSGGLPALTIPMERPPDDCLSCMRLISPMSANTSRLYYRWKVDRDEHSATTHVPEEDANEGNLNPLR